MTSSTGRRLAKVVAGASALALGAAGALLIGAGPAQAATTVKAQLSLTGIATSSSPVGGSVVGIHPGDSVTISPAGVPTAGLSKLGLDGLVNSVTGLLAQFQVTADFAGLPGGAKSTVLAKDQSKTFTFPKAGTYDFTWSFQQITLLGLVPIALDGNQLKAAGVKLNAQNQYVGKVVVATNPPQGGLGLQLPGVSVQPQVGPVSLPKVSLPGVTTPTIPVQVPDLTPVTGGAKISTSGSSSGSKSGSTSSAPQSPPALPVPALVVPQAAGAVIGSTGNYQFTPVDSGSGSGSGQLAYTNSTFGTPAKTAAKSGKTTPLSSTGKNRTVTLAASRPASTSGMPVILALVAVIALVLVAGTYARLFLLHKQPADRG